MAQVTRVARRMQQRAAPQGARAFLTQPFEQVRPPVTEMLAVAPGQELDVLRSISGDDIVGSGDVWLNTTWERLAMFAPSVSKAKAIQSTQSAKRAPALATDEFRGFEVMDVADFEDLRTATGRDLYLTKRLFVEDAAVGSSRTSEIRVRVITDDPEAAAYFRNKLQEIPQYDPEFFNRHICVVIARGQAGKVPSVVASDVDLDPPNMTMGNVVARGDVPLEQVAEHLMHCAARLAHTGGYRHLQGGAKTLLTNLTIPELAEGAKDTLAQNDRWWKPSPTDPHPNLCVLPATTFLAGSGAPTLALPSSKDRQAVVDAATKGAVPDPAAELEAVAQRQFNGPFTTKTGVYAADGTVWTDEGLSRFWAGARSAGAAGARGTFEQSGSVTGRFTAAQAITHPEQVVLVSGKSGEGSAADAASFAVEAAGVQEDIAERFQAQIEKVGAKVVHAKSPDAAVTIARG